jgi:glyoxylate reductase
MKVVITHPIPLAGVQLLRKQGYRIVMPKKHLVLPKKDLCARVKGADAVLSFLTDDMDAKVMDAAGPKLRIIANYAVGFDNVDLEAAHARTIVVTNTPVAEIPEAVAEHTIALMLTLVRHIEPADRFVRSGKYKGWDPELFTGMHLAGKSLGLVGLGRIGKGVAKCAVRGFGMQCSYHDVVRDMAFEKELGARYETLHDVLKSADVVSLHVPLLPATRHLMTGKTLRLMKKTAILINTARGPIVDQSALVQALSQKKIAGAALDVFEFEPRISASSKETAALRKMNNVLFTPHIASATREARDGMAVAAAQSIIDVLSGKPLTPFQVSGIPTSISSH